MFLARWSLLAALPSALCAGCGSDDGDRGHLTVLLQAEDTITEGLEPGTGREDVVDGWTVRFDKYVVALGNVKLGRDAAHIEVTDDTRRVYDLVKVPQTEWTLTELTELDAKRYDFFGYDTVHAETAQRDPSVNVEDYEEMAERGATYLIEGTATRDAESVTFRFVVPSETQYGPCEVNGVPGLAVPADGTATVGITIHGDHVLFDSFGSHDVRRRAQWIADADTDGDGHVDEHELEGITGEALSQLLPADRYSLGGWAAFPIESAFDFLRAQLHTQGHYQGEGECVWTVGGVTGEHDHDHDH